MSDAISQIQQDLCDLFNADPYFVNISILQEKVGVRDNDVLEALGGRRLKPATGGKTGAAVVVQMPSMHIDGGDPFAVQYECDFSIRVWEVPKLNRASNGTGKTAEEISQYVDQLLHNRKFGVSLFLATGRGPIAANVDDNAVVGYDCTYTAPVRLPAIPCVMQPRITQSGAGSVITIASNTPSASFYYTTDGSLPTPAKTLYSAPFASPGAGVLIRSAGYLANLRTSDATEYIAI